MVIYKYPVEPVGRNTLKLPAGAKILWAGVQGKQICIWALVDPNKSLVEYDVFVVGTGWVFEPTFAGVGDFLNTVFVDEYVFHVFKGV